MRRDFNYNTAGLPRANRTEDGGVIENTIIPIIKKFAFSITDASVLSFSNDYVYSHNLKEAFDVLGRIRFPNINSEKWFTLQTNFGYNDFTAASKIYIRSIDKQNIHFQFRDVVGPVDFELFFIKQTL